MEIVTQITKMKHNTVIKNQQKFITLLIIWTLLSDHHPYIPACKRKYSKTIKPDNNLKTRRNSRTLLFKHKNLSNDNKSLKPIKRLMRFQR